MEEITIVGIDLETSCLDPSKGVILEASLRILDPITLKALTKFHIVLDTVEDVEIEDDFVLSMHRNSGLLDEAPTGTIVDLENFLNEIPGKIIFLGSSVQFDQSWILHHLPNLARRIHYRIIDVSGMLELVPDLSVLAPLKPTNHRSEDDLSYSIKLAELYKHQFEFCLNILNKITVDQ